MLLNTKFVFIDPCMPVCVWVERRCECEVRCEVGVDDRHDEHTSFSDTVF